MADAPVGILDPAAQEEFARQMAARRAASMQPTVAQPTLPSQPQGAMPAVKAPTAAPTPSNAPVAQGMTPSGMPAVTAKDERQAAIKGVEPTPSTPPPQPVAAPTPKPTLEDQNASAAEQKLQKDTASKAGVEHVMDAAKNIGSDPDSFMGRHPGIAKIARIGSEIGAGALRGVETAGDILAPRIMARVPGTELHHAVQLGQDEATAGEAEKNRLESAQAQEALGKAATAKNGEWSEVSGGAVDPAHPELGQQQAFYNKANPEQRQYAGPMKPDASHGPLAAGEVDNANKGFLDRFKVLNPTATALPSQYTLPANATKEQRDFVDKQLEQVEKSTGTKAQNDITEKMRQDQATEHTREYNQKQDEQLINYTDPKTKQLVSGTRGEARAAGVTDKDMHGPTNPALQEKSRQAYTQYQRILDNVAEAGSSMPAWDNESDRQAAMKVAKMYFDHVGGTVGIAGAGINPEYLQQAISSDAYRQMTPEGRAHMQNMFQLWSDAINIVKQETGGVPKGAQFVAKEDAILPHPEKTQEQNEQALAKLQQRIKTDAKEYARPSDVDPLNGTYAPRGTVPVEHEGKVVGYATAAQQKKGTYTAF